MIENCKHELAGLQAAATCEVDTGVQFISIAFRCVACNHPFRVMLDRGQQALACRTIVSMFIEPVPVDDLPSEEEVRRILDGEEEV